MQIKCCVQIKLKCMCSSGWVFNLGILCQVIAPSLCQVGIVMHSNYTLQFGQLVNNSGSGIRLPFLPRASY